MKIYRKRYIQIYLLILLSTFIVSCKGQNKTELPKNSISQAEDNLSNDNPYFVESESIITPYGPNSITRNILQDKKGNIWLASWQGVMRYNGDSFANITNQVSSNRFFALLEDRKENFWFTSIGGGVYYYDGKSFTNFTTNDGLPNNRVTNVYEDKKGDIWFTTIGGASRYDGESFHNFIANESDASLSGDQLFPNFSTIKGLTNNDVNSVVEDVNGVFWFGTRGEACTYDGQNFTKLTNDKGEVFTNVRCIIEDKNGHIWLGGNDGLWRYDGHSFQNFTTDFVGYVYEDKAGNIWTSSDIGYNGNWVLSKYNEKDLQNDIEITATQINPQRGMLFGISEDKDGNIWFGSLKGIGRYNGISFDYFEN